MLGWGTWPPYSAEVRECHGALQMSCWGSARGPGPAHRVTGDARMLLSEMSSWQRLCLMGSNVHCGVGSRAPGFHMSFFWPSFLAQWGPSTLSLDFSIFCFLLISLLLSERLPGIGCWWCPRQCAAGHATPTLCEGNTDGTTQAFFSRRPLPRGGCPSLGTFCVLGYKCDWATTARGCWQALGALLACLRLATPLLHRPACGIFQMAAQDVGISCMELHSYRQWRCCQAYLLVIVCSTLEHAHFVLPASYLCNASSQQKTTIVPCLLSVLLLEGAGSCTDSCT